jgi:hypothetical protein
MRTLNELQSMQADLPAPRDGAGTVHLIVLRLGDGEHDVPKTAQLDVELGVVGDRWSVGEGRLRGKQVTLMNHAVAELVADGKPMHMSGDNFLVDIDLSEAALPVGTLLELGTAILRVSEEPHRGCKRFAERFGKDAVRWLNDKKRRPLRLRGVNCSVERSGDVSLGGRVGACPPDFALAAE